MRRLLIITRIHIIQIRAKRRFRLSLNNRVINPVDEIESSGADRSSGVSCVSVVLKHPQAVAVLVSGVGGRFCVYG